MTFKNTGIMCMLQVPDPNREEGFRYIDVGNYFITPEGTKCVITSFDLAQKYQNIVNIPMYIRKEQA